MVDNKPETAMSKIKGKASNAKKAVVEKIEVVKVKAAETKEAIKAKLDKLQADYNILEEKCKVQARLLRDKITQSQAMAASKTAYDMTGKYLAGVQIVPEKKLVYCKQDQVLVYGYVETRSGNTVSMREVAYIENLEHLPIIDIAKTGQGNLSKETCWGVMVISSVDIILDVAPDARAKLDSL